jgi:hypothetical protein
MAAGTSRAFPVQSSSCGLPADAQVYSLNVTVVPRGDLGYLTMWPSGEAQPLVSTLNDPTGTDTANAAIVPAASNGDVSVYVSNSTDVVLDVDGYFAAPATGVCRSTPPRHAGCSIPGKAPGRLTERLKLQ